MKKRAVIGIDEVGRGPLAGPITVCAFYISDTKFIKKEFFSKGIRDSKRLSKANRYKIYKTIKNYRKIENNILYSISSRSAEYIDTHGIQKATSACVLSCVKNLRRQGVILENCLFNLDAGLRVPLENIEQKSFVKGDEKFTEIAMASIMAKETRDAHMRKLNLSYPEYNWRENVGYGTKLHREAIEKNGITKYHRKSFLKNFNLSTS